MRGKYCRIGLRKTTRFNDKKQKPNYESQMILIFVIQNKFNLTIFAFFYSQYDDK